MLYIDEDMWISVLYIDEETCSWLDINVVHCTLMYSVYRWRHVVVNGHTNMKIGLYRDPSTHHLDG